ncbi:MAG: hypothetical protein JSS87_07840 [Acidobacteria bacterium]|nr:hypothetical protein [Acidobacteriota bacterium]
MMKTISKWIAGAAVAEALLFAAPQKAQAQTSFSFGVSVGSPGYYRPYYATPYVYRPYYGVRYYRPYYPGYYGYYHRPYVRVVPRGHAYGYYHHYRR